MGVSDKNKRYFFETDEWYMGLQYRCCLQRYELKLIKQGKNTENKSVFPL